MERFLLVLVLFFLAGCQSVIFEKPQVQESERKYPPVSATVLENGILYGPGSKHFSRVFVDELAASGLFTSVSVDNTYVPLKIYGSFVNHSDPGSLVWFGKFIVSTASLLLIPVSEDFKYEATFQLVLFDRTIRTYEYERSSVEWIQLFRPMHSDIQRQAAESIMAEFINDLSSDMAQLSSSQDMDSIRSNVEGVSL